MADSRIYRIDTVVHGAMIETRLIRAGTQAAARNHAAKSRMNIRVADQNDIAELVANGCKVEQIGPKIDATPQEQPRRAAV